MNKRLLILFLMFVCIDVLAIEPIKEELKSSLKPMMPLEEGWKNPPPIAKTRVWWWWLNGNVTREAITRDLEEMKAKGIGGANIIDAGGDNQRGNRRVPHGPDFASPEWCEFFTHAVKEADRLGLELGFNIQSGWNLGGPKVTPEEAAKRYILSELDVDGGQEVKVQLPEPEHRDDYYHDVAVAAFPIKGEMPRISSFEQKAYKRYPFRGRDDKRSAAYLMSFAEGDHRACAKSDVIDLTAYLGKGGKLKCDLPKGKWKVIRLGYTCTGAHVSTCSEGWEGRAIDYLDRNAFNAYWDRNMVQVLNNVKPFLGKSLAYLHTDSWELGTVNWTIGMEEKFKDLRGYEITPYIPALAGYVVESREVSTRFLNDLRRTLADLMAYGKYENFSEHAHALGLGIHPESGGPHCAPLDSLRNMGISDIPMGEFWARNTRHRVKDTQRIFVKQTASATHVYGRRLCLAESFTTIGPHWQKEPRELKPTFDRSACEGHNLTMWHTFDCSPKDMGIPGSVYFAGTHFNPNITWWDQAPAMIEYMNRCHFLLQQGLPVSDVLHFYGENIPTFVPLKRMDPLGILPGYDYDAIDKFGLLTRTSVKDGRIVMPDGMSYRMLVLPDTDSMSLESLQYVAKLAEQGAVIVGRKPERSYGLDDDKEFRKLVNKLWGSQIIDEPVRKVLEISGIEPDFSFKLDQPMPEECIHETAVDYFHRRTHNADIYFVANRLEEPLRFAASFRIADKQPEFWDPITGAIRPAKSFTQKGGRMEMEMALPKNGSVFVVFRQQATGNRQQGSNFPEKKEVMQIKGAWEVEFDPEWGPGGKVRFDKLVDWIENDDPEIKYYSGTATYRKRFTLSESEISDLRRPQGGQPDATRRERSGKSQIQLDLGQVGAIAEVKLNGVDLGTVWTEPFAVDVTDAIKPGENELEVKVVNLWANRIVGDAFLLEDKRRTRTNITRIGKKTPLIPSGLLGPVTLRAAVE